MPETAAMTVDFDGLGAYERYKLMASLIAPRPIALVTTVSAEGVVNAAPFSMFAMVGEEPPLLMISLNRLDDGGQKDTAANIAATGEFVVHLADEAIASQMHRTGERHPPEVDETAAVGFTTVPSDVVAPPRILEAPVAFECTLWHRVDTDSREVLFGRIHRLHARDGLIDTERWHVRLGDYHPVGRFGASFYTSTRDRFTLSSTTTEIDQL